MNLDLPGLPGMENATAGCGQHQEEANEPDPNITEPHETNHDEPG